MDSQRFLHDSSPADKQMQKGIAGCDSLKNADIMTFHKKVKKVG
ncbi:MAG: hypothetical protein ACI4JN_07800 [Ruminococcus sp.]